MNENILKEQLEAARELRNERLADSDWTQLPDSPLSTSDRELWRSYRQQLRDITEDFRSQGYCDFPVKPKGELNAKSINITRHR